MQVKLISITQSRIRNNDNTRYLDAEEHMVYCARISNPSNQLNLASAPKLINYCIKNHHWSVFEQASMGVEIITSRAIAQQIVRHRSFSFQEFSQRYAAVQNFEPIELRQQALTNRQSSTNIVQDNNLNDKIEIHLKNCENLYNELLEGGIAKETARFVLPLTTQTKLFMFGTVRSWIHYLAIRSDGHTQKEHQVIALEINKIFIENFPNVAEALKIESGVT